MIADRDSETIERVVAIHDVGRAVNPQHRESDDPRPGDYAFEGYELQDALDAAGIAAGVDRLVTVIRRSRCGPGERAPEVLLVAPPPVTDPRPLQRVWGFSAGSVERAGELTRFYREVAENQRCAFLDGGATAAVSPSDGVHLDAAAHQALGKAIADSVRAILAHRQP